ncbi:MULTISPECIES: hypothetical protein [Rhodococcus]|uniref:hypothetical protein n=1 Tax=Rhodococcus TaxID=1827 RepID=UPI0007AEC1B8|nr:MULTISPECIES: hypothetical protein [Rhodococcus]KZL33162.1 hypothetical protein A3852_12760 [Rhodococcus qingshengii]MCE4161682.1 hypothetical protein [Rhodococcus sp. Ni2]
MTAIITPGTKPWQLTVSASKVPKIYGVAGDWGGPRSVYEPMRAALMDEPFDDEPSSQIQRDGHFLEPAVRAMWHDRNPELILHGEEIQFVTDAFGFPAMATPDDLATLPDGEHVTVQLKTDRHGFKFGKPGTDEIPLVYYVQVLWELHVARQTDPTIARAFVVVGTPYYGIAVYIVHYNAEQAAALEAVCLDFYVNNVLAGVPPAADGSKGDYDIIRRQHPEIEADSKWEIHPQLAIDLVTAQADAKTVDSRINKAKSNILDRVGNAKEVWCGGQKIAQRQPTKKGVALYPARKEVDLDKLHAHLIDFESGTAA